MTSVHVWSLLIMCPFTFAACAWPSPSPPAWLGAPDAVYARAEWITGLGVGATYPLAADRAVAAVGQVLGAELDVRSRQWDAATVISGPGGAAAVDRRVAVWHDARTITARRLSGVRLLGVWRDPATGLYSVLAGLERRPAAERLRRERDAWDRQIQIHLGDAERDPDALARVRALDQAARALTARREVARDLAVVDPARQAEPEAIEAAELTVRLRRAWEGLPVAVEASGPVAESATAALVQGLAAAGARIAGEADAAAILVAVQARVEPAQPPEDRYRYARWCAALTVRRGDDRRVVGVMSLGGREGHLTQEAAEHLAAAIMVRALGGEGARRVMDAILGRVDDSAQGRGC